MRRFRIGATVVVAIGFIALLLSLLLPKPKMVWNAGARQRLTKALHLIARELVAKNKRKPGNKIDLQDFTPRSVEHKGDLRGKDTILLVKKHGVLCNWRENGNFVEVLFYPIALSKNITLGAHLDKKPMPQIVMVPVDKLDRETLPNLHGCENVAEADMQECQLRRMKELFSKHGITYAAALMSDKSVEYIPIDELGQ